MTKNYLLALAGAGLLLAGCEKFLDEKPRAMLVVPTRVKDAQTLLDNEIFINNVSTPYSGEASADDFYVRDAEFQSLLYEDYRRMYLWKGSELYSNLAGDFTTTFRTINYANTALDVLAKIPEQAATPEYRLAQGQALFIRARSFYLGATTWAPAFDEATASTALGMPLRQTGDFTQPSVRASLRETYDLIIRDMKTAAALLPTTPVHRNRPGKGAVYAMLAQIYLSMRKYPEANLYADSCLKLHSTLLDYNTLNAAAAFPIPAFNVEVIVDYKGQYAALHQNGRADTTLYRSYAADDLRKTVFFRSLPDGSYQFKGFYQQSEGAYGGCVTDEIYLIRAECLIRENKVAEGMKWVNDLLVKRYRTGKYVAPAITTQQQALAFVLAERRKELVYRNVRWPDIKRLNLEGANITLTRKILGVTYTLPPNSPKYALPFPENVIALSGMQQNPQ